MKIQRNLILITSVYVIILISLFVLGLIGDSSEETINFALKHFSRAEIDTGKAYFLYTSAPIAVDRILEILFLLIVSVKGYHSIYAGWLSGKIKSSLLVTFISFISLFICFNIIEFPFVYFASFLAGKKFGLMNAGLFTWMTRYISSSAIGILITCAFMSAISIIIKNAKRYHIYVPIAALIIGLCIIELYPKFIIPLFYKMEVLPDSELKNKIKTMCGNADIEIDGIYTIDSGRISNSINAYMVGTGGKRKIIIYDTLLKLKNDDEILTIVAHEICHYAEEHMLTGISIAALSLYLFIPLLNRLSKLSGTGNLKCLVMPRKHSVLILLLIVLLFLIKPVKNTISRYFEKRADTFALNITGKPDVFIAIKKKMAVENKSNILPGKIYSWFYYTHPSALDRMRCAEIRLKPVKPPPN